MFKDHTIFEKTTLGRTELQNRLSNLLPRELRTILIVIDGKKRANDYSKVFKKCDFLLDYSSINDCLQALLDLEMIAIVNKNGSDSKKSKPSSENREETEENIITDNISKTDEINFYLSEETASEQESINRHLITEVVGVIEDDIPEKSWEYVFELESATYPKETLSLIEKIYRNHKLSFSNQSIKTIQSIIEILNGHYEKT